MPNLLVVLTVLACGFVLGSAFQAWRTRHGIARRLASAETDTRVAALVLERKKYEAKAQEVEFAILRGDQ